MFIRYVRRQHRAEPIDRPSILILTPLKDVAGCIDTYCALLERLTFPPDRISLGFLESDSSDQTYETMLGTIPRLSARFHDARIWKHDFAYRLPAGTHRWDPNIQLERRAVLARSRNQLLMRALGDHDWVLWIDADLIYYPRDSIEQLLATGKNVVQPHCVLDFGGPTFDQNAWRDRGRLHLDDLRNEGDLVRLDTVGGTMLLVNADLHRDGLIFPAAPYGSGHPLARKGAGEIETEGLGILAHDLGETCWGLPRLEILHRRF
jgi:hypothetical protein